ncbi:anhydro-N-acetylmuramic acid kinase [Enemella dayhoffiae]|uniref:Anhydro-N-acetylmuramic acid kinase n=2 Tax=Enemella dayhoffiae TaxID=2016507 RepID=A0A255H760_9ACTN|nr:anhydro-N-acetylmuramic acid kinase [Enemella dayhoffiae]
MHVLGMISGTSHDGIDAAVVEFGPGGSDRVGLRVVGSDSVPYAPELRARLVAALPPARSGVDELCRLDTLIGQAFADVAQSMAERHGPLQLISSHGQTVFHWVQDDHALGTLQIGQPAWIAERTGVPVVADLRARDVAAGGHGAPLVPLLDELLLAGSTGPAAALNLGGIANLTLVRPGRPSVAHDIGPANALVDAVVQDRGLDPNGYDTDGRIAAGGRVDSELLQQLLADPYYRLPAPKSTGKEHFHLAYVTEQVGDRTVSDTDLVATLTRLTAETVAADLRRAGVRRVVAAGGGCENPTLIGWLTELCPGVELIRTEQLGIPAATKEAVAFALLGWCTWHGMPGNVASATGASGPRVLGAITPGRDPLRLPEPLQLPPRWEIRR